jgi:hypothetical protein
MSETCRLTRHRLLSLLSLFCLSLLRRLGPSPLPSRLWCMTYINFMGCSFAIFYPERFLWWINLNAISWQFVLHRYRCP